MFDIRIRAYLKEQYDLACYLLGYDPRNEAGQVGVALEAVLFAGVLIVGTLVVSVLSTAAGKNVDVNTSTQVNATRDSIFDAFDVGTNYITAAFAIGILGLIMGAMGYGLARRR